MFDKIRKSIKKNQAPKMSRAEKAYIQMVQDNAAEATDVMNQFQNALNVLGYDIVPNMKILAQNVVVAEMVLQSIKYSDFLKMNEKKAEPTAAADGVTVEPAPEAQEASQDGEKVQDTTTDSSEAADEATEDERDEAEKTEEVAA